ncbi:prolyl oligopeptidase family serine peptidase [Streptomyces sp. XD-27]|uniref:S9 family peptidase n=1 Tax=Streptomyces sp. XD-27 TaxID=3062779 RepID=UPI0026F41B4C|nr:prolyl oligopeptidase family serine peptidase [Streptomyces sp. XD-27]WKX73742.1 prolyl oligopeptidase family serine peptidase [Streptomyces sp. XD-27]
MKTSTGTAHAPGFPRQLARTRRLTLGVPRHFTVSPDGSRVLFLRTGGSGPLSALWAYEDGAERILADPRRLPGGGAVPQAELDRRERVRERSEGVVAYATDRDVRLAVFALGGALWAVRTDGGEPFPVPAAGPVTDPRPSPDGRRIAYVTGGALHVTELGGTDRRLAAPEGPEVTYGLAEFVAAEEIGRSRGHWWAPDGSALLVARVDPTPVRLWFLSDPADPAKPPRRLRYPVAGTANADVSLSVVTVDGRRTEVRWDRAAFEYLVAAVWDAHGLLIDVQSRDQRTLRTLAVDPATGETALVAERTDPAWVQIVPGTPARTASGALVRPWEDGGTRGLRIGEARTPAGLQVREVLGVDGERVLFLASEEPTEAHVWCHEPGRGFARLSEGPGVHRSAAGGGTVVLDSLTPDGPEATVMRAGAETARIACRAERPLVTPRPRYLRLGARELRSALYLPSWYEPGSGRLPVLLDPYGGAGTQLVLRARGWTSCLSQWFAEQGYAVLVTDGRGTPGRGPAWEKEIRGDRLGPPLEDQVDALHAAAEQWPDLDLTRVGIRGWSFGGALAAAAVLHRPDVFHAAVAGAAPTDRSLYDTHWEERFLGHPDKEPENYARSSLLGHVHKLRRPLLLIHGLADDNVAPAHMLRFSAELLAAGRPHTVLPLPGATHLPSDETVAENLLHFQLDFLNRSLTG